MPMAARDVPCARRLVTLPSWRRSNPQLSAVAAGRTPVRRFRMRTLRTVAIVLLLGLVTAACGARLDPQMRKQAAEAVLTGGGGSGLGTTPGSNLPGPTNA